MLTANAHDMKQTASQDVTFWSYVSEDVSKLEVDMWVACKPGDTYQKAILVPSYTNGVDGKNIEGLRIALVNKQYLGKVWIWISTTMPETPDKADIVYKEIDVNSLPDSKDAFITPYLTFDEPYYVDAQDIYLGYSFQTNDAVPALYSSTEGNISTKYSHYEYQPGFFWWDKSAGGKSFAYIMAGVSEREITDYTMGDVNLDGSVNVTDVTRTVGYILDSDATGMFLKAADMNADGAVNVTDVELITDVVLERNVAALPAQTAGDELLVTDNNGTMNVMLPSAAGYRAFQMDVTVPEGSEISDITLNENLNSTHVMASQSLGNGKYRVIVRSKSGDSFADTDLLTFSRSSSDITIDNIIFVTTDAAETHFSTVHESDVTSIDEISADPASAETYTIGGVKVSGSSAKNGVFIINGKKIIK